MRNQNGQKISNRKPTKKMELFNYRVNLDGMIWSYAEMNTQDRKKLRAFFMP